MVSNVWYFSYNLSEFVSNIVQSVPNNIEILITSHHHPSAARWLDWICRMLDDAAAPAVSWFS